MDLIGKKFNRLVVLTRNTRGKGRKTRTFYKVKCQCGTESEVRRDSLLSGKTKSCGCLGREMRIRACTKHNLAHTKFYLAWQNMKRRVAEDNRYSSKYYADRGIKVCDRWSKFENFRKDMHLKYIIRCLLFGEKNTTLDRIDNNGDYTPENCRWTDRITQMNNTRKTQGRSYGIWQSLP